MTPEDILGEYDGSPADIPLSASDYASYFSTRLQARLPKVREYIQDRKKHRTPTYYRAQAEAEAEATAPAGPAGAVLGDVPFPLGMEVALDPSLGLGSAIIIPADLRQAPPPLQLDLDHITPISRKINSLSKIYFTWMDPYWISFYACKCLLRDTRSYTRGSASPGHTSPGCILSSMRGDLEIGRLRRHQSRQSGAVTRLQMEVDRLRTRLEVEGIPLDFSEDKEDDDDGSSSDDAPPAPPSQAAASPSRRRR
ncbi:hypothetical protein JCGZ_25303 [Jatropha curcas]|uniref:Uncharacterized protein n=1 Tax=Jatropha curcas TaxID=180498 RepID=A0A067JLJ4_JATCU|nr:hypothetical protein JCGZ_25303 [Jatropha curcas]